MTEKIKADLCVIGAGSGGLSIAAGAAQMGADVVLLERDKMGGDCLNYGCVPSKSLLAAGHGPQEIIDTVLANDVLAQTRQYAVLTLSGEMASRA